MDLFNQQSNEAVQQMSGGSMQFDDLMTHDVEMELSGKLKGSLLGGYSKKSVEDFAAEMRGNLLQIKAQLEQQIHDITVEKANVSRECAVLREQLQAAEENSSKLQNQIVEQTRLEEKYEESESQLSQSREEVLQLRSMLAEYGDLQETQNQLKQEIQEKEDRIASLNTELAQYKERCRSLEEKSAQLEEQLHNVDAMPASDSYQEEIKRYQDLFQEAKTKADDLQKRLVDAEEMLRVKENAVQSNEEEAKQLSIQKSQLQKREDELRTGELNLEKNRADLQDLYRQLQEDIEKNQTLSDQLNERSTSITEKMEELEARTSEKKRELEELNAKMAAKKQELTELEKRAGVQSDKELSMTERIDTLLQNFKKSEERTKELEARTAEKKQELEELEAKMAAKKQELTELEKRVGVQGGDDLGMAERIDTLFQNFKKSEERTKGLEAKISEKNALIQHYQKYEAENILLRKECELDRKKTEQLRETLEAVMLEMESQAEGVQMYAERAKQDRESLQRTLAELTTLKLEHVELMDSMSRLTDAFETMKSKNQKLKAELEQMRSERTTKVYDLTEALSAQSQARNDDPDLEKCNSALQRAKMLVQQFHSQKSDEVEEKTN